MIHLIDMIAKDEESRRFNEYTGLEYTIPKALGDSLDKTCSCGYLFHTNFKLTDWYCPNPYCEETNSYKVIKVFETMHKRMNIGKVIALDIIKYNKFQRHMDFICINNPNQFPNNYGEDRVQVWIENLNEMRTDITLSSFVTMFQLDRLGQTVSNQLFAGKSLDDIACMDDITLRKHIRETLKFSSNHTPTEDTIVFNLTFMMPLLKYYSQFFKFKEVVGNVIKIALTGSIPGFDRREDIIPYLEDNYYITPQYFNSYSSKIDYLIYDEDLGSSKIKRAKKAGKAIHYKDFMDKIESYKRSESIGQ